MEYTGRNNSTILLALHNTARTVVRDIKKTQKNACVFESILSKRIVNNNEV